MKLKDLKVRKVTKPDFGGKFWITHKVQKCGQIDGFLTFLKNYAKDLDETWSESRGEHFWTARENRVSKETSVLEIFIHKVQILAKIAKSVV